MTERRPVRRRAQAAAGEQPADAADLNPYREDQAATATAPERGDSAGAPSDGAPDGAAEGAAAAPRSRARAPRGARARAAVAAEVVAGAEASGSAAPDAPVASTPAADGRREAAADTDPRDLPNGDGFGAEPAGAAPGGDDAPRGRPQRPRRRGRGAAADAGANGAGAAAEQAPADGGAFASAVAPEVVAGVGPAAEPRPSYEPPRESREVREPAAGGFGDGGNGAPLDGRPAAAPNGLPGGQPLPNPGPQAPAPQGQFQGRPRHQQHQHNRPRHERFEHRRDQQQRPDGQQGQPQGQQQGQNQQGQRFDGQGRAFEGRPGRRQRHRNRQFRDQQPPQGQPQPQPQGGNEPRAFVQPTADVDVTGWVELAKDGSGFVRQPANSYLVGPNDPFLPVGMVRQNNLRAGDKVEVGAGRDHRGRPVVVEVRSVDGAPPQPGVKRPEFGQLLATYPDRKLKLELGGPGRGPELTRRVVDLIAPIGFGQRALIVAPARTGKTMLLQALVEGVAKNYPEAELLVLLVDERPEEVSDMVACGFGEVVASSFDMPADRHRDVVQMVMHRAQRSPSATATW
jgi:transcription termination factor Rho